MAENPLDPNAATIATFEHDGQTYEIDHLGLDTDFDQWGQFAVYQAGMQVAGFAIAEDGQEIPLEFAAFRGSPPETPAELPVTTAELIEMARQEVARNG